MCVRSILACVAAASLTSCDRAPTDSASITPAALSEVQPAVLHFKVSGMVCESCEHAIAETVKQLPGVVEVQASHKTGNVDVRTNDPGQRDAIAAAIAKLNYTVDS